MSGGEFDSQKLPVIIFIIIIMVQDHMQRMGKVV